MCIVVVHVVLRGSIAVDLPRMITKAQVKDIRALATSKGRQEQNAYIIDGDKLAREWLTGDSRIHQIVALESWIQHNSQLISKHPEAQIIAVSAEDLDRISTLHTPNGVLLVAPIPVPPDELPHMELCRVLDTLQDPGNLGAIIRIADWFGIGHVVCSPGCVDYYNPKVVSAAMGGHLRVKLHTTSLSLFLRSCGMPVLAATLKGENIQDVTKPGAAALVIGNESKGISSEVLKFATQKVTIPRRGGAESLNAAVSAGILVAMLLPE
jgi:TrmH family RNA methyltransferase